MARGKAELAAEQVRLLEVLRATQAVLDKARTDVRNSFTTAAVFTNQQQACNSLMGSLAWELE